MVGTQGTLSEGQWERGLKIVYIIWSLNVNSGRSKQYYNDQLCDWGDEGKMKNDTSNWSPVFQSGKWTGLTRVDKWRNISHWELKS